MTVKFMILQGSQHFLGDASVGLYQVGTDDGGFASFGVGLAGKRYTYRLTVDEKVDVPDLGALTLLEVSAGESRGERGATFGFEEI